MTNTTSRPYYVKSGDLEAKIIADSPFRAAMKAMERFGDGKTLDPHYFYIGERSAENPGQFRYPVDTVLEACGFTDIEEME